MNNYTFNGNTTIGNVALDESILSRLNSIFHSIWFPVAGIILLFLVLIYTVTTSIINKRKFRYSAVSTSTISNPNNTSNNNPTDNTIKRKRIYNDSELNSTNNNITPKSHNNQEDLELQALTREDSDHSNHNSPLINSNTLYEFEGNNYYANSNQTSEILTIEFIKFLYSNLPPLLSIQSLKLYYSLTNDGASINTFYHKLVDSGPTLLIIKDSNGYIFGCFCIDEWRVKSLYYGSQSSFVFSLNPTKQCYRYNSTNFNSSAANINQGQYFMLAKSDSIAIGGGNDNNNNNNNNNNDASGFAIWLDSSFYHGKSLNCATFGSPSLASNNYFNVSQMEVWGFA